MQSESVSAQRGRCPQHPQCPHLGPGPWETWSPLGLTSRLTCEPPDTARDPVPEVPARVCPPAPHPGHGQQARVTPRQVGCACVSGLCPPSNSLNWGGGRRADPQLVFPAVGEGGWPLLAPGPPRCQQLLPPGMLQCPKTCVQTCAGPWLLPQTGGWGGRLLQASFLTLPPSSLPPCSLPGSLLRLGRALPQPLGPRLKKDAQMVGTGFCLLLYQHLLTAP